MSNYLVLGEGRLPARIVGSVGLYTLLPKEVRFNSSPLSPILKGIKWILIK